jgi:hypothetical protein
MILDLLCERFDLARTGRCRCPSIDVERFTDVNQHTGSWGLLALEDQPDRQDHERSHSSFMLCLESNARWSRSKWRERWLVVALAFGKNEHCTTLLETLENSAECLGIPCLIEALRSNPRSNRSKTLSFVTCSA